MRHRGEPERTEPRQLTPIGPVAGAFGYCAAAGMILMGPAFALWGKSWWDGLCPGLVTLPLGVALAFAVAEWRRSARRFAAAGLPATAEIIAVEGIRGGGEDTEVAELRIRISGTGFETFDAACELTAGRPPWAVGDRLDIVVDPADNSFVVMW
ncbi:hypothetical protein ACWCPQ_02595 [Nocardia sp. NPDC001965]